MISLVHATGNENVRQAAVALHEADLLCAFWTCLSWNPASPINRFLPGSLLSQLKRRSFPPQLRQLTKTMPARELCRLLSAGVGLPQLAAGENAICSIERVMESLDRRAAAEVATSNTCRAVYAYEDGARHSFRAARNAGKHCLYDLPIGYWRAARSIYLEEAERMPEWAPTLTGAQDSERKRQRKEEELQLADCVFVASHFTRSTVPPEKQSVTHVIPYGAPDAGPERLTPRSGKLKVLYVGSLGQRKGLSYLLEAVDRLASRLELTLIGRETAKNCRPLEQALKRHRWIASLPRDGILREMRDHHVLVLPSLFEGFGLVLVEAMAQSLPVIATPHTAAPDLIEDGGEGFIVPIRSSDAIAEKLDLLQQQPDRCLQMGRAAREKALGLSWQEYRRRLARVAREVISKDSP